MHTSFLLIKAYATSLVRLFGDSDGGKLSSIISSFRASSIVCPGFLFSCNCLKCFLIFSIESVACGGFLVDCKFCFSWCKCPCVVGVEVVRCFFTKSGVNPGHELKKDFLYCMLKR